MVTFTKTMLYEVDGARLITRQMPCGAQVCAAVGISTPDFLRVPGGLLEIGSASTGARFERVGVVTAQ